MRKDCKRSLRLCTIKLLPYNNLEIIAKMNKVSVLLILASLFLSFAQIGNLQAQGVLFSEYRLILKDQTITSLQVCNPTTETLTFNLSFINKRMDENGATHEMADTMSAEYTLKQYLRIYPRTIRLDPDKCQEVQIQLKAPSGLPDGEYRSYLHFLPLHNEKIEDTTEKATGVKLDIIFRVGAAIPIIYRKNTRVDEVRIDSVSLSPVKTGGAMLGFIVRRTGTQSTYGRFLVEGISNGANVTLMDAPGSAVFTEMDFKRLKFPISTEKLDRSADGKVRLKISYVDAENKSTKTPTVWATTEADVSLP